MSSWCARGCRQVSGLQEYVRRHCRLAKRFESHVLTDPRFQVMNNVKVRSPLSWPSLSKVGLVCFRLLGSNQLNKTLLTTINASGRLHMVRL